MTRYRVYINTETGYTDCEEARRWYATKHEEYIRKEWHIMHVYLIRRNKKEAIRCAKEMINSAQHIMNNKVIPLKKL